MQNLVTKKFKIHNAEQFIESLSEVSATNLYMFIGKNVQWDDETDVPAPKDSVIETHYRVWNDMIAAKKVSPSDVKHVVPRINWNSNTAYFAYNHTEPDLFDQNFYILTDDMNVYKCLQNNLSNGASTVMPTGTGIETIETSDGYKWKYLYTINTRDSLKFLTKTFMPVQKIGLDNSDLSQSLVEDNAVDGAIDIINKTSNGDFLVSFSSNPTNFEGESQDFIIGETIIGQSSNNRATVIEYTTSTSNLTCRPDGEKFAINETVIGLTSNARSIVSSEPISSYKFSEGIFTSVTNSTVMFLGTSANTDFDNLYVGSTIFIQNNAGQGEKSVISAYDSFSRRIIVETPFTNTPNTSSGYIISPTVTVIGDGSGADARTVGNTTHGITDILVTTKGEKYTTGTVTITSNSNHGSGASGDVIIGPIYGHGRNSIEELGGNYIIVDVKIKGNESGYFTTSNDYRQIGLLRDPLKNDGTDTFFTSTLADQSYKITLSKTVGTFEDDEIVYQGDSLQDSSANGYVVDVRDKKILRMNYTFGELDASKPIIGAKYGSVGTIASSDTIIPPDIKPYSGDILYVENKEKIQRLPEQFEDFKILLEF